jgi:hypothetical protein
MYVHSTAPHDHICDLSTTVVKLRHSHTTYNPLDALTVALLIAT